MLATEFDHLIPEHLREENQPGGGLYPKHLRGEIDAINDWVYNTINNGVYKVGFARSQEAYDANIGPLFDSLDRIEEILGHGKPYIMGDNLTEVDVRLYTTIARFDVAYVSVFQCTRKTVRHDYPRISLWFRRLYWDQDEKSQAKGAFYKTTEPNIARYAYGYADSRKRIVFGDGVPLIVPDVPAVPVEPL